MFLTSLIRNYFQTTILQTTCSMYLWFIKSSEMNATYVCKWHSYWAVLTFMFSLPVFNNLPISPWHLQANSSHEDIQPYLYNIKLPAIWTKVSGDQMCEDGPTGSPKKTPFQLYLHLLQKLHIFCWIWILIIFCDRNVPSDLNLWNICLIWSNYSNNYEEYGLLGGDIMYEA